MVYEIEAVKLVDANSLGGAGLGPVVCHWPLKSKVRGSSHSATWPNLKLTAFFPSGPQ